MDRFVGEICGLGTASGTRIVVGRWTASPLGSFADAMVERPDGRRTLIAPTRQVVEYVGGVYSFDETVVADVMVDRSPELLSFRGGPLVVDIGVGRRDALGWLLRAVPRALAVSPTWATVVDPIARVALRGVRTRGSTPGGDEFYGALDRHRVVAADASWDGQDLGSLADVSPPVRFGFSSAPRQPSIVEVVTTVRRRP